VGDVVPAQPTGNAPFTVSANGDLAYVASSTETRLTWMDREGVPRGIVDAPSGQLTHLEMSPDATRFVASVVGRSGEAESNYLFDVDAGGFARLSSPQDRQSDARWSADGRFLAFSQQTTDGSAIVVRPADGSGPAETRFESSDILFPSDWSFDGGSLVFRRIPAGTQGTLWVLPAPGGGEPEMISGTEARGMNGRLSPDGRWIAYSTTETGQAELYVQPFPVGGLKFQVSTGGGIRPRWSRNSDELFFVRTPVINGAGPLMVTAVETDPTFRYSEPQRLFDLACCGGSFNKYPYDVTPDGQRVLVIASDEDAVATVTLVLNWPGLLER
jgi:serine/threonine-protein kinase